MSRFQWFKEENEAVAERMELSRLRIKEITLSQAVKDTYKDYFKNCAKFLDFIFETNQKLDEGYFERAAEQELQQLNTRLYEDITGDNYQKSFANPAYAYKMLGEDFSRELCFLYTELRGLIVFAFENNKQLLTLYSELFLQIYCLFEDEMESEALKNEVKDALYYFNSDNADITVTYRIRQQVDPSLSFAADLLKTADLTTTKYLYCYGEFISENELRLAEYLNTLSEEEIVSMASTFTEGYRRGFALSNKDISKKRTVNIRYELGFERVIRESVRQFEQMGLEPVIYRAAVLSINKRQQSRIGYHGTAANRQYLFDHRFDEGLYLDAAFKERKLSVLRTAYEEYKELCAAYAGPAVLETFGYEPFTPENKPEAISLTEKQKEWNVYYAGISAKIANEYIPRDEISFTIISYPRPEISDRFEEIFKETIAINTLDYATYQEIQQKLIDALDEGAAVHITGAAPNKTDLTVQLHELADKETETNFENCLADVNIPLGEVFTSPKLKGTTGLLFICRIFIEGLEYKNLWIRFEDGMTADYGCGNFETAEEGKAFVRENILFNHEALPMGEFAIGTNTTAYRMANRYNILKRMEILITEKMGPHFAVGDTCFRQEEDNTTYNPDGKRIIAKDNECSILRKQDETKAYFSCHTDITISYDDLDSITVLKADGGRIPLIAGGRFVLPGSERLNIPLDEL